MRSKRNSEEFNLSLTDPKVGDLRVHKQTIHPLFEVSQVIMESESALGENGSLEAASLASAIVDQPLEGSNQDVPSDSNNSPEQSIESKESPGKSQRHEDYLAANGELKLELPETLEHEDFSKLLEFDGKNDDDLFSTQEILQHAIHEAGAEDENIEHLSSELRDTGLEHNDEEKSELPTSPNHSQRDTQDYDDHIEKAISSIKEETLSPRRTLSEIDQPEASKEHTSPTFNSNEEGADLVSPSNDEIDSKKEHEPSATTILEKGSLLQPKRHDSLTPVMFQQHELLTAQVDPHKESGNHDSMVLTDEQPTISAYARLDFQSFTFYVQTLHVIIGRRSENDFSHKVDVNLGPSKSISRRHAQIFYNFGTGRFEVSVIGKNGAFVDDIFVERGNTVPLKNKTKIQIGQIPFQFVLPEQEKAEPAEPAEEEPGDSELHNSPEIQKSESPVKVEQKPSKPQEPPQVKQIPKKQPAKKEKEKKPAKVPKKVYTLEEIPEEYRTKPTCSYSALLTTCIRKYSSPRGMSLSEIYNGIRELFPYYTYCPDGWQSSVRHNLSLNKSFRKVSKEGKGWLWGLDEDYIAERERQKKKQAEAAAAKAAAAQKRLEQQQQQRAKKGSMVGSSSAVNGSSVLPRASNGKPQSISQTLAANRAADKNSSMDDHQRTMKYLQEQLMVLTRDRKGLSKQVIASILTQALAMTINQVSQAAKSKGITGNPLTALMDKNPQHLNLILAAAVNAATSKVTNGKIKQLVDMSQISDITKQVTPVAARRPASSSPPQSFSSRAKGDSSFDPTSLSRFFQPRQPSRMATPPAAESTVPQKRSLEEDEEEESSGSEETSSSEEDNSDDSDDSDDTDDTADNEEDTRDHGAGLDEAQDQEDITDDNSE